MISGKSVILFILCDKHIIDGMLPFWVNTGLTPSFITPDIQTVFVLSSTWDYHSGFWPLLYLVIACALYLGLRLVHQVRSFR